MNRSERRMRRLSLPLTFLFLAATITVVGCSPINSPLQQTNTGQSNGGSTGLFITLNPSGTIFVDVGLSRQVSAVLANDVGNKGVTWVLSGPGSITNTTTTTVLYTAPSSSAPPATITATSVGDTTQVASATLFIGPLPTITTTTLPDSTVGGAYNSVINVAGGASPFNWSIASGITPPGLSFSVSSNAGLTVSGSPTAAGTYTFTLQVRDVCNAVASQSYTIKINPAGPGVGLSSVVGVNNALLSGNYAFGFSGFGGSGLVAAAGSFTADGKGNITGGVQDRNSAAGPQTGQEFTGTYSVGANQLGLMTLNNSDGTSATYAIAVTQEGNARFIEVDGTVGAGTQGSGEMKKRDAAALSAGKSTGSYAFELSGVDMASARMAVVGEFAANDSGALTQGQFDANDAGNMTNLAPISGSYSISATGTGRAALELVGFGSVHLGVFAVSPDEAFAVETDARSTGEPLLAGRILRQSGGPFTTTSLSGTAVLQMTGSSENGPEAIVGAIQFSGTGDAHLVALDASMANTSNIDESSFLAPGENGRAVFGTSGDFITYFVSPRHAFVLGTSAGVFVGSFEAQDAGPFDASSFAGTFVGTTVNTTANSGYQDATSVTFDGKQLVTKSDISISDSAGLSASALPIPMTYSFADGMITLSADTPGPIGIFFIVSPRKAVFLPMGTTMWDPMVIEK